MDDVVREVFVDNMRAWWMWYRQRCKSSNRAPTFENFMDVIFTEKKFEEEP